MGEWIAELTEIIVTEAGETRQNAIHRMTAQTMDIKQDEGMTSPKQEIKSTMDPIIPISGIGIFNPETSQG